MILTAEELIELTGRRRAPAQAQVLRFMGIECRPRPDGKLVVLRVHVNEVLGITQTSSRTKQSEPNWEAAR
jgi:hypothetical protein